MKAKEKIILGLLVILAALFYLPIFRNLSAAVPGGDWYAVYSFNLHPRLSFLDFHQLPLRSAHFGGGYPLIGHPYDISLSPLSWFVFLFGAVAGTKIAVFVIFILGALGVFLLSRRVLKFGLPASLFSALTFSFSSWGPCVYLDSNYEKLQIYLLPLALFFFVRSWENRRYIFLTSLVLVLLVFSSGAMILPALVFLLVYALLFNPRSLKKLLLIGCMALLLSSVKLLPMHNLFSRQDIGAVHFAQEDNYLEVSRHVIGQKRALDLRRLYAMLFVRDAYIVGTDWVTGDDHLQFNLGFIPVLLALAWFIGCWRKAWRYAVLLLIFIMFSFGPNSRPDIFRWFWELVPYAHGIWRTDEFFTFPILLILAIASGGAFVFLERRPKPLLYAVMAIAFLGLNQMFWPNRRFLYNQTLNESPKKMVSLISREESSLRFSPDFFQVKIKDPQADPEHYQKDGYFYLRQNIGVADWLYTNLEIKSAVIPRYFVRPGDYLYARTEPAKLEPNPDYRGEAFFPQNEGRVAIEQFSPARIRLNADLKVPAALVVNQNYHPSWRSDHGRIFDRGGLLAVSLDKAGKYSVTLTYLPVDFYLGLGISFAALIGGAFFFFYRPGRA